MDILSFLHNIGAGGQTIGAFVIALLVIVTVHEYGHYIVGRWVGIKADVFSVGFGPVLISRRDRYGTRWQIAALPLGGYVRFREDADPASTKSTPAAPPQRTASARTMHNAPLWARSATVIAGPVFNFILSILLFAALALASGRMSDELQVGALRDLPPPGPQMAYQILPGDRIVAIEQSPVPPPIGGDFEAFLSALPRAPLLEYQVLRDGQRLSLMGPHPRVAVVASVAPRSAAQEAGVQAGDVITAVAGQPVVVFDDLRQVVEASGGQPLELTLWRGGEVHVVTIAARRVDEPQPQGGFETHWRVGIISDLAFVPARQPLGWADALEIGTQQTWDIIDTSLSAFLHIVRGAISSCNLSGVVSIAEVSATMAQSGLQDFVFFIALLSTAIGLINLFPIPVLDGGHLLLYAYEAVVGRPPRDFALRILISIGLAAIISLFLLGLLNDLVWC
ncbi:MAG: RIP metalloprotease RseP [Rhodobacteraceae bacterium]|nr:RIP metalloprotease RseP [Paracoccaceae bacterium]